MTEPRRLKLLTNRPSLLDYAVVEERIKSYTPLSRNTGDAFVRYILSNYFNIASADVDDCTFDNSMDRGVDFIYICNDKSVIHIGNCKAVSSYRKSQNNFPGNEVDKIISFIDDLVYKREYLIDTVHGSLAAKIRTIWDVFSERPFRIVVHLFSNQLTLADAERARLVHSLSRHRDVTLEEHGLYELSHGVVRASRPTFTKKLHLSDGNGYEVKENGYRGFQSRIKLADVAKFLEVDARDRSFDDRLIDHNVRFFLGNDNSVNREIRSTLIAGNPHDFWFLNNGLTIVCEQILGFPNGCHPLTLKNAQIVNGGQTAKVIHAVATESLVSLGEGSVSVKLIETTDRDFIERIAIASNTQSRIYGRDLRANDHIQEKLSVTIASHGYFYKRKRGETTPADGTPIIDAARAGQAILAYACGEPSKSKTDSNDIFDEHYAMAFDPNRVTADLIVSAFRIQEAIESKRQLAIALQKSLTRNSYGETWLIEGHFHVLFVVGELMRRLGAPLSDCEKAISLIPHAIATVECFVRRHPGISAYRLFRSVASRSEILTLMDEVATLPNQTPTQGSFEF